MKTEKFIHLPDPYPAETGTPDQRLKRKAEAGLKKRLALFKQPGSLFAAKAKEYKKRLNSELRAIREAGIANYILIAADIVDYARRKGIPVGPGLRSATASLVNYSLGITKIDPIKYGLIFERFLDSDPDQLPSIDLDFCVERRPEILRYAAKKYGKARFKQLVSFPRPRLRATVREVGRILNLPLLKVNEISRLIPWDSRNLKEAIEQEPRLKKKIASEPIVDQLFKIAVRIEDQFRLPTSYPSGFVLADKPITDFLPLYQRREKAQPPFTLFDREEAKKLGLAVYDFLSLRVLTKIDRCVKLIQKKHCQQIDIETIPLDDEKSWALFGKGDTDGVFVMEAQGCRELLKRLKPQNIEELAAIDTLHRPGLEEKGIPDSYVRRKEGKEKIPKIHPGFDEITRETLGLILYREQVMMIAHRLAGFPMNAAYGFFKMVIQGESGARNLFLQGCARKKIPKEKAAQIFNEILRVGSHAFLKSHAISYALLSYQTVWLKANYPVQFAASFSEDS